MRCRLCRWLILIALTLAASACQLGPLARNITMSATKTDTPTQAKTASSSVTQVSKTATLTPTSTPTATPTADLLSVLSSVPMPPADPEALAQSMQSARVSSSPVDPPAKVGDQRSFWLADVDQTSYRGITATLRVAHDHVQMWVENGVTLGQRALESSARVFDESIYATVRDGFGHEWNPGIDADPRLVVLNGRLSGAAGYFASANELTRRANPYSNRAEMFVMNISVLEPGTEQYDSVLAHEFQHMIHWYQDRNESAWVNEGASQLAEELAGYDPPYAHIASFVGDTDLQLTTWSDDGQVGSHYGAAYLFVRYVRDRLGQDLIREWVAEPADGMAGLDHVLALRRSSTSDELVADWFVANVLGDQVEDPRYSYVGLSVGVEPMSLDMLPDGSETTVSQFGADYYDLPLGVEVSLAFTGTSEIRLVDAAAASGRYAWWSNRGDSSHSSMQREIDLSQVVTATLCYDVWHDIEPGWDYAHLRISEDGGQSWALLRAPHMTDYNPVGNALGWGYTGISGAQPKDQSADPVWVREQVDLSAYAGQVIWISLDYVTDDSITYQGLCADNWAVEAIGWSDDAEGNDNGWVTYGFIRHDNKLPQRYLVRCVEVGPEGVTVRDLAVEEDGRATWRLKPTQGTTRAFVIIAGMTPYTTLPARYTLAVEDLSQP